MKFKELSPATADTARNALTAAIVNASPTTKEKLEMIAEGVAAAFIRLERFDGAPDECGDGRAKNGQPR
ncbi:hypothetical protein KE273_04170 [Klebsiella sp. MC1F]|uniref:hypothetical protein n=1 Tax=Klebsiella TaxID=570 RepID=UPI000F4D9250|nr:MULTISPECIES: hypothetical protein [Klebsiella]DAL35251.1 MAG TPA_asm: hypothetical protein [Caudoviricetes sp.]HDU3942468.1 hypothetical protein [Klebsiella pneumoniae subsp. pneumoniae]EKZ5562122.1 hypothetical protein [Klebsiella pneumoniae]EKZ5703816.1 hypothetical protein [Klebsiella pneumoniae]EKZ6496023.1 hypothetical protein [Klebsiella pneumoniae]